MYVPGDETGAKAFLQENPEFDGRGIVIAIVDSGADIACGCLRTTSTGKVKIIDQVDCSGNGDVSLVPAAEPAQLVDGKLCIKGLSGRILTLNANWKNPTGVWRLGCRPYGQLVSLGSGPVSLLEQDRKKARDEELGRLRIALNERLKAADSSDRANLEAQIEALGLIPSVLPLEHALVDVVSWHDGDVFRAVVTRDDVNLTEFEPMTDYAHSHQFGLLDRDNFVSFTLKFFQQGKICNIFTAHSHGTICASISAGHWPDLPEQNGIAPGAQIVNIRYGNVELGSCESHFSMQRVVQACVEHKVDIVSMSYGEFDFPGVSFFATQMTQAIKDHGILFCTSAGNDGPGYHTTAHPYLSAPHFAVGALLPQGLASTIYGQSVEKRLRPFRFSSRGPSMDGYFRANVTAPGASNTMNVGYSHSRLHLANGTSMACPNVAGGLALILSALRKKGISYNPWSIVAAAEASASKSAFVSGESWADYGCGLFRVPETMKFLEERSKDPLSPCYWRASSVDGFEGLCFRQSPVPRLVEQKFYAESFWPHKVTGAEKSQVFEEVVLVPDQPWISCSTETTISKDSSVVKVVADTSSLSAGTAHFGQVVATNRRGDCKFRIPVSIFVPEEIPWNDYFWSSGSVLFQSEDAPFRRVLNPPVGATHFTVSFLVESIDTSSSLCYLAVNQVAQGKLDALMTMDYRFALLDKGQKLERSARCSHGILLDLAVSAGEVDNCTFTGTISVRFWSYQIEGGGFLNSSVGEPVVYSGMGPALVGIRNAGGLTQTASFNANAKYLVQVYSPSLVVSPPRLLDEERFRVLGASAPLSELEIHFVISVPENGLTMSVATMFDELQYCFSIASWTQIFREGGTQMIKSLGYGGLHSPSENFKHNAFTLPKGSYLVKQIFRDLDAQRLMSYCPDVSLRVRFHLPKPVVFSLHKSMQSAHLKTGQVSSAVMAPGAGRELWIMPPKVGDLPSFARAGDLLFGSLQVATAVGGNMQYPLTCVVQLGQPASTSKPSASAPQPVSKGGVAFEDRLLESELLSAIGFFSSAKDPFPVWDSVASEKLHGWSRLPYDSLNDFRVVCLRAALASKSFDRASSLAADIIKSISQSDLAQHFGQVCRDPAERARMIKRRDVLIEALIGQFKAGKGLGNNLLIEEAQAMLGKWVEPTDPRMQSLVGAPSPLGMKLLTHLKRLKEGTDSLDKQKCLALVEIFGELQWPGLKAVVEEIMYGL